MQVKPRFETYKILEQYPLIKDDTGNEMCLTLLEAKLPSSDDVIVESTYKFWSVIGKNQQQWNNKAVSYSSVAFWKTKTKDKLFKSVIRGFIIEEKEDGEHRLIDNNPGLRTVFKIKRVEATYHE